jgi:hypothetical protein
MRESGQLDDPSPANLEDAKTGETWGLIERRNWNAEGRGNPEIRQTVEPKGREVRGNSKVRRQHGHEIQEPGKPGA